MGWSNLGGWQQGGWGRAASIASASTTWNPSDKSTDLTLSNGNLTATATSSSAGSRAGVRATTSHTTGKWVFEVTITLNANGQSTGLSLAGGTLTNNIGSDTSGYGYLGLQGLVLFNNGNIAATYAGASSGDVIGIAYDGTSGSETMTVYKNGSALGSPISISAGPWFPAFSGAHDAVFGDDAGVLNCGQSAFVGTYTGFSAWG